MLIMSNISEIFLTVALEGIVFIYKDRVSAHLLIFLLLHCYVTVSLFCSSWVIPLKVQSALREEIPDSGEELSFTASSGRGAPV